MKDNIKNKDKNSILVGLNSNILERSLFGLVGLVLCIKQHYGSYFTHLTQYHFV